MNGKDERAESMSRVESRLSPAPFGQTVPARPGPPRSIGGGVARCIEPYHADFCRGTGESSCRDIYESQASLVKSILKEAFCARQGKLSSHIFLCSFLLKMQYYKCLFFTLFTRAGFSSLAKSAKGF